MSIQEAETALLTVSPLLNWENSCDGFWEASLGRDPFQRDYNYTICEPGGTGNEYSDNYLATVSASEPGERRMKKLDMAFRLTLRDAQEFCEGHAAVWLTLTAEYETCSRQRQEHYTGEA